MLFKILLGICIAAEFVFVPLFLKYSWPKKCYKSLAFKMICSTLFMAVGFLVMKISGNGTDYAKLILWGLFMGWLGDLFLHLITDKIYITGIGLFTFLAGHIFYIIAFQKALHARGFTNPSKAQPVVWYEIVAVLLIVGIMALYVVLKKIKAKWFMAIPVTLYAFTISYMLVKAFRLFFTFWAYGTFDPLLWLFVTVPLGAVLFVLSDGSLGLILFGGMGGRQKLKWFNIGTYYAAQVLLACSIFLLKV